MSNSLDPDQARHLLGLIWIQTVSKGYQQTTKVATSRERVKSATAVLIFCPQKHVALYQSTSEEHLQYVFAEK